MTQKHEGRKGKERPNRPTIRRSAEYRTQLSVASDILAAKMEEKREEWATK